VAATGARVVGRMPPPVKSNLRWDTQNPHLRSYIAERTGKLIVGVQEQTRLVVSRAITRSFDQALTPRRVADLIKPSIGLYPQQVTALDNYRQGLLQKGHPDVDRLTDAYEERLLDYRAMMIGRTEANMASNEGQLSVWNAAADQGLIDRRTAQKVWQVDGDPCKECEALDGVAIDLDDSWDSDDGPIDSPPLHPNCFCTMEIQFNDEGAEAE
jgi:hypothetical protein